MKLRTVCDLIALAVLAFLSFTDSRGLPRRQKVARRVGGGLAIFGLAVTVLTACGASGPVTYAPAAYGQNGQCYYVNSPAEVTALKAQGVCPASWAAAPMPVAWLEAYYPYYDSSAYYDTYVPASVRTVYVQREATFGRTHRSAITVRSKTATYRSSSGGTVKGSKISTAKVKFGSGTSFGSSGSKYGGGSLRSKTGTGTSGRTSTGSRTSVRSGFGGGSLRSSGRR